MKKWKDKYVIGLTGNIATGKSVVRRMLEHLGAYGIDADALGHRALAPDSPAYPRVLQAFGASILTSENRIDRARLGKIVFADPAALKQLEGIVHPFIRQAIDSLVKHAPQPVIVLEAIKLLEGELHTLCDSIWVTHASAEAQLARLLRKRRMKEADARLRIAVQPTQELKLAAADVVIYNDDSFESTWQQVIKAWNQFIPGATTRQIEAQENHPPRRGLFVRRANPDQAHEIAQFINRTNPGKTHTNWQEIMAEFSQKTFITLRFDDTIIGVAGWSVDNLVGRVDDVCIAPHVIQEDALRLLLDEAEKASQAFQCEVIFLFLSPRYALRQLGWEAMGYEIADIELLNVQAWEEAVHEAVSKDTVMLIKRLGQSQVFCA